MWKGIIREVEEQGFHALSNEALQTIVFGPPKAVSGGGGQRHSSTSSHALIRLLRQRQSRALGIRKIGTKLGIPVRKLITLGAVLELQRRQGQRSRSWRGTEDAIRWLKAETGRCEEEAFFCVPLDVKLTPLGIFEVARGNASSCPVSTSSALRPAVVLGAPRVLFAHNHPSGSTEPSHSDFAVTAQLATAANLLDIEVIDHIILAGDHALSLRNHATGFAARRTA